MVPARVSCDPFQAINSCHSYVKRRATRFAYLTSAIIHWIRAELLDRFAKQSSEVILSRYQKPLYAHKNCPERSGGGQDATEIHYRFVNFVYIIFQNVISEVPEQA
jgi:hypothetical protein